MSSIFEAPMELRRISTMMQLQEIIKDFSDVFYIELITEKTTYKNVRAMRIENIYIKKYQYFIADKIQTLGELFQDIDAKYIVPEINSKNKNKTAIKTCFRNVFNPKNSLDSYSIAPAWGWHILDADKDIVLDSDLKQIYPYKTGKIPAALKKLFAENNYIPLDVRCMDQSKWNLYKQYTVKNDKQK